MRVCIVYDCLFPWTVGGAERWYRHLAERLAADGHVVTYLTRLQWDTAEPPDIAGVEVVAVSPAEDLYGPDGRRRIGEALRFGRGVFAHLRRHRRDYDVVHTCAFPYFSVFGARAALLGGPARLHVDWFEFWTAAYWRRYLGLAKGTAGAVVQALCALLTPEAFVFSRRHAERLGRLRRRAPVTLPGLYAGGEDHAEVRREEPLARVVFAGRHIAEKRVPAIVPAIAAVRRSAGDVTALILGDGPERAELLSAIDAAGLTDAIDAPGFVAAEEVDAALADALCLLLPSEREGYGMVVIEAAARGTPSVVVSAPDNAAIELVVDGVNGLVAASSSPDDVAAAILAVRSAGPALRRSTAAWFDEHAGGLSADASVDVVLATYLSARS